MALFVNQEIISHAGVRFPFKIECDVLMDEDIKTLAAIIVPRIQKFSNVYGIPNGGVRLANELLNYRRSDCGGLLIVDDVYTTGKSMREAREKFSGCQTKGVVIFARGKCPEWITPIFQLNEIFEP